MKAVLTLCLALPGLIALPVADEKVVYHAVPNDKTGSILIFPAAPHRIEETGESKDSVGFRVSPKKPEDKSKSMSRGPWGFLGAWGWGNQETQHNHFHAPSEGPYGLHPYPSSFTGPYPAEPYPGQYNPHRPSNFPLSGKRHPTYNYPYSYNQFPRDPYGYWAFGDKYYAFSSRPMEWGYEGPA